LGCRLAEKELNPIPPRFAAIDPARDVRESPCANAGVRIEK